MIGLDDIKKFREGMEEEAIEESIANLEKLVKNSENMKAMIPILLKAHCRAAIRCDDQATKDIGTVLYVINALIKQDRLKEFIELAPFQKLVTHINEKMM